MYKRILGGIFEECQGLCQGPTELMAVTVNNMGLDVTATLAWHKTDLSFQKLYQFCSHIVIAEKLKGRLSFSYLSNKVLKDLYVVFINYVFQINHWTWLCMLVPRILFCKWALTHFSFFAWWNFSEWEACSKTICFPVDIQGKGNELFPRMENSCSKGMSKFWLRTFMFASVLFLIQRNWLPKEEISFKRKKRSHLWCPSSTLFSKIYLNIFWQV